MSIKLPTYRQVLAPFLCPHCNQRLRLTRYIIDPPTLIPECTECANQFYFQESATSPNRPKPMRYDEPETPVLQPPPIKA